VNQRTDDRPLDQLHSVVRHLLETHEQIHRTQERLDQMTQECAAIMARWSRLDEQHARALADIEHSAKRVQRIERNLQQGAAPETAEGEPQTPPPTTALGQAAAALSALLDAFERVEGRLAAREQELGRWMADMQRELRASARQLPGAASRDADAAWPLDNVLQLHQQLRDQQTGPAPAGEAARPESSGAERGLAPRLIDRRAPQPSPDRPSDIPPPGASSGARRVWLWGAAAAVVILAVIYFIQIKSASAHAVVRAEAAEQQLQTARQESRRELDALRESAKNETSAIREAASKAKVTADILTAPDLLRFDVVGQADLARARGQALVSRSRGIVFTASRLPSPPRGSVYEVWLLTTAAPVRVASIEPDAQGRVSYASDTIPPVPGRIVGLVVSRGAPGGHDLSSAQIALAKPPKLAA